MTTAEIERSIAERIGEVMDRIEDPSPMAIAEVVLQQLDPEDDTPAAVRHFALSGIAEDVRAIASRRRRGTGGATQSARWSETARQHSTGELDLARIAVFTGTDHKWLPDCSPEDLEGAAAENQRQAEALLSGAGNLTKLAEVLRRKRGAKVVGDLPAEKVRSVLNA